jgi:hypothetical protein
MKIEPVRGSKFAAIVRKYGGGTPSFATPVLQGCDPSDPLAILLSNYLLWESTPRLAEEALSRIARVVVDVNDLRVMLESEVVETIGEKYPFVEERAQRLRATLNDIFRRQHRTSLDHLRNASRKDQRSYLEGLAEIPPFVSGRTLLVAFESPAPIADDTTVELLHQQGAIEPTATTADVVQWIGKHHRIEELAKLHHALSQMTAEAWSAGQKNGMKVRGAYIARHEGFREVERAAQRKIEEERLAKIREAELAAETKRLEEVAREEARIRLKREAEEAKVRARVEREAARVAAIAERARKQVERERERVEREKKRERDRIAREKDAIRKAHEREVAARKAAVVRERRERERQKQAERKARLAKLREAKQLKAVKMKAVKMKAAKLKAAKLKAAKLKAAKLKAAKLKAAKLKAAKLKAAKLKAAKLKAAKVKAAKVKAAKVKAAKVKAAKMKSSKMKAAKRKPSKAKSATRKSGKSGSKRASRRGRR